MIQAFSEKMNVKMDADSTLMSGEYLRLFVAEAINRAKQEAETAGDSTIEPHHIEMILPQLLLDF